VPGHPGEKVPESEFYTHTPGNDPYLANYRVVPLGDASAPPDLSRIQFPLTTEGAMTTPSSIRASSVPVLPQ
jgi:hypothetical protein